MSDTEKLPFRHTVVQIAHASYGDISPDVVESVIIPLSQTVGARLLHSPIDKDGALDVVSGLGENAGATTALVLSRRGRRGANKWSEADMRDLLSMAFTTELETLLAKDTRAVMNRVARLRRLQGQLWQRVNPTPPRARR